MSFNQVFERNKPVPGIWERNGVFYGQIRIPDKGSRRFALKTEAGNPVATLSEAEEAFLRLRRGRAAGDMPGPAAPTLGAYTPRYLAFTEEVGTKSPATCYAEAKRLSHWVRLFGKLRLGMLTKQTLNEFALTRKREGVCNGTINLEVIALTALLNFAKDEGVYTNRPITDEWTQLPHKQETRPLLTTENLDQLTRELRSGEYGNGEQAADLVELMAYSGGRLRATLNLQWSDVDLSLRQLTFPKAKGDKRVVVDFNPKLEGLLQQMQGRRTESRWLFPSPAKWPRHLRGTEYTDRPAMSFDRVINAAAKKVGFDFNPHDCRHYFASHCVMSGVDFRTTAHWLGHADNGTLLTRRYSHLSPEHNQAAAAKVNL